MRKIITILCTLIFTINLSANAAIINVNEDSLLFSESKEEEGTIENKNNEEIYENHEIKQNNSNELISDSEIEKVDENILSYDESNNITTEDKNFIMQEQQDEFEEELEEELFVDENINEVQKVEEIQTNKEKEIKSYSEFEVVVEKGNSIEITWKADINSGSAYIKENYNSKVVTYDEIIYWENGQISYTFDESFYRVWLDGSANKKIKLSLNQGEKMTLVFPNEFKDKLDIKVTNTPIAKKVSLQLNKSYEIINSINEKVELYTKDVHDSDQEMQYHMLTYDKSGKITNNYSDVVWRYSMYVNPNGKTKIKVISGTELNLYIPYEYIDSITLKESSTPVFEEFILEKDKIYEFTNNTLNEIRFGVNKDDTLEFNYITFEKDEKRNSVKLNIPSYALRVEAENTILFEVDKKPTSESKLYIPYEYRNNLKISDGKVFNKVKIEKNKGYTIKNNSNDKEEIYFNQEDGNKYTWDSVTHNENGKMISLVVEQPYMNNYINSNYTEKMTFSEDVYLYTLYKNKNLLDIKEVSTPSAYKIDLITGKSYELKNKSSDSIIINTIQSGSGDSKYDIVEYNKEGKVESIYYNSDYNFLRGIDPYSKSKISKTNGSNEIIVIPYDQKDLLSIKELSTPIIYNARIKSGEVYEFINKSNHYITLKLRDLDQEITYDYITYYNDETIASVVWDSEERWHNMAPEEKIKISLSKGDFLDLSVPYEFKDTVKKLSTPMFQKIEVKKGKSYELKSNKPINVYVKDENDEFRYDYLIYDDDGDLTDTSIDNSGYGLYIRENQTYRIAMNSKSNMEKLEFYIPYEDRMTVKELNNPLIKTITLDNKNNYEIINKMKNKYTFTAARDSISNEVTYEIISYDKNGNIKYIDSSFDNYFSFQCDGKIRISILKGNNLTFYVPYDFKYELNTINTPLTFKMDILPDKTYEISNSYLNVNIVNHEEFDVMREEFDVIQYGVNGDVVGVNHVTASTYIGAYENINGITKIRLTKGEKLELVLPYENRNNIKETNTLLVKEIPFKKNKEYKIKNNNSFDIFVGTDIWGWDHIFDDVSYKITYYDSKGNIKETLDNQFSGFEIKANESVKLSINKDGYNLHVPYEATIVDDDSESDSEKPMLGDFNNDGKVDILDLSMLAMKYDKKDGEAGWDSKYDLNNDFIIDIFDLSIVAKKL